MSKSGIMLAAVLALGCEAVVADHQGDAGLDVHAAKLVTHAAGPVCNYKGTCDGKVNVNILSNVNDGHYDDATFTFMPPSQVGVPQVECRFACAYAPEMDAFGNLWRRKWMCFETTMGMQHWAWVRHLDGGERIQAYIPMSTLPTYKANHSVEFELLPGAPQPVLGGPSEYGPCVVQNWGEPPVRFGPALEGHCGWYAGR